jgi:hypothetical protein
MSRWERDQNPATRGARDFTRDFTRDSGGTLLGPYWPCDTNMSIAARPPKTAASMPNTNTPVNAV